MATDFGWHSVFRPAILASGAFAALMWLGSSGPALAVIGTPPTVQCTGKCEACEEAEVQPDGSHRCVKCGVDPNCVSGDAGLSSDFTTILNMHNQFRKQQCAGPLTWSSDLAKGAQDWANACTKTHSGAAFSGGYGEALYWGSGTLGDADDAANWWYNEVKKYSFTSPVWSDDVGHFTQMVWKGSNQLGCGVARCGNENYWVCRYSPAGNQNVSTKYVSADQARKNLIANVGCVNPGLVDTNTAGGGNAPGGITASVIADVDVYPAAGGEGKKLGILRKGSTVSLLSPCKDYWCNVAGNAVPKGKGWVYSNPDDPHDFQSLKY
jgi:uncharacterized protein YkwD